ncbi:hypothetical protein QMU_2856, partial [Clostridioides difficile DA00310]
MLPYFIYDTIVIHTTQTIYLKFLFSINSKHYNLFYLIK